MSKVKLGSVAIAAILVFLLSCGTIQLANKAWKDKYGKTINWTKQQGIVLPIDVHGFGATEATTVLLNGTLMMGFMGATLDENKIPRWVSIQPALLAPPFNQNLSHEMAWNVFHMADFHTEWDPRKDIHGGAEQPIVKLVLQIPNAVKLATALAEKLIQEKFSKPDFKINFAPRFLAGAHVDSDGVKTFMGKGANTARVRAFLYDAEAMEYISYTEWSSKIPWTGEWKVDEAIVIGKFATLGGEILGMIIGPLT